jgi:hypothetical protein
LDELYVTDSEFKRQFASKTEREGKKARYILATLERQAVQKEGKHLVDELRPDAVTLEHIFPKSPGKNWQAERTADPSLAKDMLQRLGNMCLLTQVNRALGNKEWSEKKDIFSKSRLLLTNGAAQYASWGRQQIDERQKFMAELAVAEWRFQ